MKTARQVLILIVIVGLVLGLQQPPAAASTFPVLADFEEGIPSGMVVFSDALDGAAGGKTTVEVTTTTADLPTIPPTTGTSVMSFTYALITNDWGYAYGGFNHAFAAPQDWSDYDGFSFWFNGTGSGNTIQVELWDGASGAAAGSSERFDTNFVDSAAGWRLFKLPFSGFGYATDWQPGPANGVLDLTAILGYNFGIVTSPSSGSFQMDDVALYSDPLVVADFEGGVPAGLTVFSDALDGAAGGRTTVEVTTTTADLPTIPPTTGTSVMSFTYALITNDWGYAYGGFNHAFAAPQDWSDYDGFSFWFNGTGSGNTIQVELWDGASGAAAGSSERFDTNFVDSAAGWRLFKLPFSGFGYATDWQPGPANGILDLTAILGYNFGIVTSPSSGSFQIDQVALFGQPIVGAKVSLAESNTSVVEGGAATIVVRLNGAAAGTVTVEYSTADGTATAGSDYTAASGTLTFAPGETEQTINVATADDADDEVNETVILTLANPTGAILGAKSQTTLTIQDNDEPEAGGPIDIVDDFESGLPGGVDSYSNQIGFVTWGDSANTTLANPVVPAGDPLALPGQAGDNALLQADYNISGWGGFTHAFANSSLNTWVSQDWSAFEGISFWLYGSGSGGTINLDIFDNRTSTGDSCERWTYLFPDDFTGWRYFEIPFAQFERKSWQPGGAPNDGLTLTEVWGYAFGFPAGVGARTNYIDDMGLIVRQTIVDDYETGLPLVTDGYGNQIGFITWGNTSNTTLANPAVSDADPLAVPGQSGSSALLQANYDISSGGWGGFDRKFTSPLLDTWVSQDWSSYEGVSFWLYGNGAGGDVSFDILDNRTTTGDSCERWMYSVPNNFTGWRFIEIPFDLFERKTGYQPGGAPNDGLTLTEVWGYTFTLPAGVGPQITYVDDVGLFGNLGAARPKVLFADSGYLLEEGAAATVSVVIDTPGDLPLAEDVVVSYATSDGTAVAGSDYTAASGTLTFSVGSLSGSALTFTVQTLADAEAEVGETIALSLDSSDATVGDSISILIGAHGLPYQDPTLPIADRVADLLARMTLEEKAGQMTQASHQALANQQDIATYTLGSLLSGGGGAPASGNLPVDWANMVDAYQARAMQTRLAVPLIYGVDAVHGHNNVYGATIFPHNIGLGATRDPNLVKLIGQITAEEVYATGIRWNFAPCVAVVRDIRWGRTYESFGETPELAQLMTIYIDGLQGIDLSAPNSVLATAKHWIGDGATAYGTGGNGLLDQGITQMTEAELRAIEMPPYIDAINRGVGTVMPSFSSVDFLDGSGPLKMHANSYLNNTVLKGELGFDGFTISDWQAIDQIPGDYNSDVRTSVNAGVDMVMVPNDYKRFYDTLLAEVNAGNVSTARIDDAVSRILTKKFELGLFEHPYSDRTEIGSIGSQAHRDVARQAVRESLVLLKNDSYLLPLAKGLDVYVAGKNADNIGNQSGGWTISWQGSSGAITPGTTILQGIERLGGGNVTFSQNATASTAGYDVGIVVVGETPYAEGNGDVGGSGRPNLNLDQADVNAVNTVCNAMPCVVVLVSGRPMIVTDQLPAIDSLVAAWLPGTEGDGVAEVLFGDYDFTGKLSFSWPRSMDQLPLHVGDPGYDPLFAYGFGLTSPKANKEAARDGLASLLPTGNSRTDIRLKWTMAFIDQSLKPSLWQDSYSLDAQKGLWVFIAERLAASELMRIGHDNASLAGDVQAAIDRLVQADQELAQRAIDKAVAADGDPRQLSKAQAAMARAAEELSRGKFDDAIDEYAKAWLYALKALEKPQAPYGGTPWAVPGAIQAENYDSGGEGVAYHDTTSGNSGGVYRRDDVDIQTTRDSGHGYNVGWTAGGEWLEYTINVASNGSYNLKARTASLLGGGSMHVEVDGADVTGAMTIPFTGGWQAWTTVTSADFPLAAGEHVMRVAIDTAGFNLNWVSVQVGAAPTPVDFGPNVHIFDPSMPVADVQSVITEVYNAQQTNHFGDRRDVLMFKPGTYPVDIGVGFYTEVLGLGATPDAVNITGNLHSDAFLSNNNATQNFWRGATNFSVTPNNGTVKWATSQAIWFRQMHVRGHMVLHQNGGWSSGGWMSNTRVDGNVESGSQQQWISRDTQWGSWTGANWNMVFVGVVNPPAGEWPNPVYTKVPTVPVVREKPFLMIDAAGNYSVRVPSLKTDSVGYDWSVGMVPGVTIPISQFYIAKEGVDTAATINTQLAAGKNLILTPGVYPLDDTIRVNRANTIVLGMGLATLRPTTGLPAMTVADVDGVTISGVLFDAGEVNSPVLLDVGTEGNTTSHASNPIVLHDVIFRIGGAAAGKAKVSFRINANDTIVDHTWVWRADHGAGVGWTSNTAANGLVVNGDDVTIYGLFVEHFQEYQTIWNGDGGRVYFYQSEIPYDPPDQASWTSGPGTNGWASYKVADGVTSHEAWGLGIYSVFTNPGIFLTRAIEVPTNPNVLFHSMITVGIGGNGGISNVINDVGGATGPNVSFNPKVTLYP